MHLPHQLLVQPHSTTIFRVTGPREVEYVLLSEVAPLEPDLPLSTVYSRGLVPSAE